MNASNELIQYLTEDAWECPRQGYGLPILITLISLVGLVANSIVIFVVVAIRDYKKCTTNIYILQLAIADFIFTFQLFFQAHTMLSGQWVYGVVWCKIAKSVKMLSYYTSIMFLTVMSVDRYIAINSATNPKWGRLRTKKAAYIVSVAIWTIATVSIINLLIYSDVKGCDCQVFFPRGRNDFHDTILVFNESEFSDYDNISGSGEFSGDTIPMQQDDGTACSLDKPHVSYYFKIWIYCNFVFAFLIPLLVICFSYVLIIRRIMKPTIIGSKSQKPNKTKKRATIMVTGLVSTFVICWSPYHSFNLARLNGVRMTAEACNSVMNITLVFAYFNSSVNPFFYTFLTISFREKWSKAVEIAQRGIRRRTRRRSSDYIVGSTTGRRKSSATDRDGISTNSFEIKRTIVPAVTMVKEEKL